MSSGLVQLKIPFNGKLNTTIDPLMLGTNFSNLINLRYNDTHKQGIAGMTRINSSVISAYPRIKHGFHFVKQQPVESHVLVQAYDNAETVSKVYQNVTAIPTTGNFSLTALWTDASGAQRANFSTAPNGQVAYCNGVESCIWGGNEFRTAAFINYESSLSKPIISSTDAKPIAITSSAHGLVTGRSINISKHLTNTRANGIYQVTVSSSNVFTLDNSSGSGAAGSSGSFNLITQTYDYTKSINNTLTDANNRAALKSPAIANYMADFTKCFLYLGSTRPLAGFKAYIGTANTSAGATMSVKYWDGSAWQAVAAFSDGTISGGITLAQTGSVSWTKPADKIRELYGIFLYWYQIIISAISGAPTITYLTTNAPFQTIIDIPDGVDRKILSFLQFGNTSTPSYRDYTVNVFDDTFVSTNSATYADISALNLDYDFLLAGFSERMMALKVHFVPAKENQTVCNLTVKYWDGKQWQSVTNLKDGTSLNGASFGVSGIITWDPPTAASEFKTGKLDADPIQLYYYKLFFSASLDSSTQVYYVAGVAVQKNILGYNFPMHANNRLVLLDEVAGNRNKAIVSNTDAPDVWNGDDYTEFFFGDEKKLTGGAHLFTQFSSNLYNMMVFFKENETWAVIGNSPEDWIQYKVSSSIGCVAPKTIQVINLPADIQEGGNRQVVIFQGTDAVYMFDGRSITSISQDLKGFFLLTASSIDRTTLNQSVGFYDISNEEYHWIVKSISGMKEFVYDLRHQGWFEIQRNTYRLNSGWDVIDTTGNHYTYGGLDSGYMMRLENGKKFDDLDIVHTATIGGLILGNESILHEYEIRALKLMMVAKSLTANLVQATINIDGKNSGNSYTFSPVKSNYRIADPMLIPSGLPKGTFFRFNFQMTTNNETIGFEPLYLGIWYRTIREDLT